MLKLLDVAASRLLKIGEPVYLDGERLVVRWWYDGTPQSPEGTVHVADAEGRVFSYHAAEFGLRVVPEDYQPEPVIRKRRVRGAG